MKNKNHRAAFAGYARKAGLAKDPLLASLCELAAGSRRRFEKRWAVVTGGASGIGRAIAVAFALEGAKVTILDRDRVLAAKTLALLTLIRSDCEFVPTELSDPESVAKAARVFGGRKGADILVNNAASVNALGAFVDIAPAEFERVLRSNVLGPLLLSQEAAKQMISNKRKGTIINILAIQSTTPVPGYSPYVASKGAMEAATLSMAVELGDHGIRVNGIKVGPILTERFLDLMPEKLKRKARQRGADVAAILDKRSATLLGRLGRPSDIAHIALFLASKEAGFMTGAIVRADGGRLISRKIEPLL